MASSATSSPIGALVCGVRCFDLLCLTDKAPPPSSARRAARMSFGNSGRSPKGVNAWFKLELKASETGLIPQEELDAAREAMSQGPIRSKSLNAASMPHHRRLLRGRARAHEGREANCPHTDRSGGAGSYWLGPRRLATRTAIWFIQCVGKERRLIDYYEASGVGLDHYAKVLEEKNYVWGTHYFPHDIANKELSTGLSRVDTLARSRH